MLSATQVEQTRALIFKAAQGRNYNQQGFKALLAQLRCKSSWPKERALFKVCWALGVDLPDGLPNPCAEREKRKAAKASAIYKPISKDYRKRKRGKTKQHVYNASLYSFEAIFEQCVVFKTACGRPMQYGRDEHVTISTPNSETVALLPEAQWCKTCLKLFRRF